MSFWGSDLGWWVCTAVWLCASCVAIALVVDEWLHTPARVSERQARENAAPLSSAVNHIYDRETS
jgi:hypothetical protein